MPSAPQPLSGQNETGTFKRDFPTPSNDVTLESVLEGKIGDYLQTLYGTPPPKNTDPDFLLVKEAPVDWRFVRRKYAADRVNEGTYNASISYSSESKDHPIFTRDYIVRRANYVPKTRLSTLLGLVNAAVSTPGSGYTFASVVLTGGTGSGGAVTAIISNGKVVQLVITSEGNYSIAPAVSIVGDGSGATGVISVQPITALLVKEDYIRQPDSDLDGLYVLVRRIYETLPGPLLSGSHIDELTGIVYPYSKQIVATNTINAGRTGAQVVDLTINNPGLGFTAGTYNLVFTGGGGTGAAGTYTVTGPSPAGNIGSVTKTSGGAGYTSIPSGSISGGGGSGATVAVTLNGTPIASLVLISSDSTFTDVPALTISDSAGTGSGATGTASLTATGVDSVAVTAGGTGYTTGTITFPAPSGGAAATGHLTFSGGAITAVVMDTPGSGYTSRPTFTIAGVDGTGATFGPAILVSTSVASVALTATGNLYQNPLVSCSQGMANASVVATITTTSVNTVTLTASGSGYSAPVVAFTGGGGSGAAATATLATGTITSSSLTNGGTGYLTNPVITTPSGGGSGASVVATIGSLTYTEITPITAVKDLVVRTTVLLSSLPAVMTYPVSIHVQRSDVSSHSLIIISSSKDVDIGLAENSTIGGSGPVLAFRQEYYMTDSQFSSFNPGGFSISGKYTTTTLNYGATGLGSDGTGVKEWTFRPTPNHQGTTAGVLEVSDQQKPYGIRHVMVTRTFNNY